MPTSSNFYGRNRSQAHKTLWSWRGRDNRARYLLYILLWTVLLLIGGWGLSCLFGLFDVALNPFMAELQNQYQVGWYATTAYILLMLYWGWLLHIRRLHDLNQTGWLSLMLLIPFVQSIFWLYLLLASGSPHVNRYGAVPAMCWWERLLLWGFIGMFLLSVVWFLTNGLPQIVDWQSPQQLLQQATPYF